MAKIQVILTADGEGYSLGDEADETAEYVGWGEPLEFNGTLYLASVSDDGEDVTLYRLSEVPESEFEAVSEDDSEEEDEEDEDEVPVTE